MREIGFADAELVGNGIQCQGFRTVLGNIQASLRHQFGRLVLCHRISGGVGIVCIYTILSEQGKESKQQGINIDFSKWMF